MDHIGVPVLIGDTHPVEQVSWTMCRDLLERHGLALPTEAQWENGCRGGSSTAWFSGAEVGSLAGFANVLDQASKRVIPGRTGHEAFDDGFMGPAPVGTYGPNAFGLHDMHGNVWEWCLDWYGRYTFPTRPGDGLRLIGPMEGFRIFRGGSYHNVGARARTAFRSHMSQTTLSLYLGVRPARAIRP